MTDFFVYLGVIVIMSLFAAGALLASLIGLFMCVGHSITSNRLNVPMMSGIILMVTLMVLTVIGFYNNIAVLKSVL